MTNKEAADVLRNHIKRLIETTPRGDAKSSVRTELKLALIQAILVLENTPDEEESQ